MAESFEIRKSLFYPYPITNLNNGSSEVGGISKFRQNVGSPGTFRLDFDINNFYIKDEGSPLKVTFISLFPTFIVRLELPSGIPEFQDKFDINDTVNVQARGGAWSFVGIVQFSDDQYMELALTEVPVGVSVFEGYYNQEVLFRNDTQIKSIEIKYNLSPSDRVNFSNGFDGGEMIYQVSPVLGQNEIMTPKTGKVKNWILNDYQPFCNFTGYKNDYQVLGSYLKRPNIQNFIVYGMPIIVPYWREDLEDEYNSNVYPDDYIGDKGPKFIAQITAWRKEDRTDKPFKYEFEVESSTGWYDENGNGGESQIEFTSISYLNLNNGLASSSLDIADNNQFTIELNRKSGLFSANNNVGVYIASKSEYERYYQSDLDHSLTYIYSGAQVEADGVSLPTPNAIGKQEIQTLQSSLSNGGQTMTIVGTHKSSVSSEQLLDIGDEYILIVTIWDQLNDQLVNVLADDNTYTRFTDETGLVEYIQGKIFDPDSNPLDIDNQGYTSGDFWNEDGLSIGFKFRQTPSQFGEITNLEFKLLAVRDGAADGRNDYSNENDVVYIQDYQIPFSTVAKNPNGLPIYQGNDLRQFNLNDDNPFKQVFVNTVDNTTETEVNINCAFKVNWQYWNELQNVPDVFFNSNDAFNGFNERTSNYSQKPSGDEYNVKAVLFVTCENRLTPFETTYAYEIPINVYDCNEDQYTRQGNFPDWTGELFTEKVDGTDLNGKVLTSEVTVIKIHWINNGRVSGLDDYWFKTRIQESSQPQFDIWEISNLEDPANNNLLGAVLGETRLKVYSDGLDGFWTECQTIPSRLSQGSSYILSGRIGKNDAGQTQGFGFSLGFSTGFNS